MRYLHLGVTHWDRARVSPGFTLFTPLHQRRSYLIDLAGTPVHHWDLPAEPGSYAHLLPGGHLLVATRTEAGPADLPGKGGHVFELDWDGRVVWEHRDDHQHHDVRRLADGNTIYLAWTLLAPEVAAEVVGGRPNSEHADGIWGDCVREVDRRGRLVWEWRLAEAVTLAQHPLTANATRAEFAHANSLFPLANGDVLVSYRSLNTLAVADRRTGRIGWSRRDDDWGGQHDAQWLDNGNILFFANRDGATGWRGSAVVEIDPENGTTTWEYRGRPPHTFDSYFVSGVQRLANANTLVCEGLWGRIFEVTPAHEIVWEYVSPHFTPSDAGTRRPDVNHLFRAYRYATDAPEIDGRLPGAPD